MRATIFGISKTFAYLKNNAYDKRVKAVWISILHVFSIILIAKPITRHARGGLHQLMMSVVCIAHQSRRYFAIISDDQSTFITNISVLTVTVAITDWVNSTSIVGIIVASKLNLSYSVVVRDYCI